ncbi:MAG: TerB family tellurite resistance protein [Cyanobacteria bacterium P01_F01_bin.33]
MDDTARHHLALKIVLGAAWADGHLEPRELDYLQTLRDRYGETHDGELDRLLERPVPVEQTEKWMQQYLRDTTDTERQQLLGQIGNLLFADRKVVDVEHVLLDDYHAMMAAIPANVEPPEAVSKIGKVVRKAIKAVQNLTH